MTPRDLAFAIVLVAVWGVNFVALKWSLEEIPPFLLTGLRYLFTALPAVFFVRRPDVSWRFMALYATAVGILQFSLAYSGLKLGMPAGLGSLVVQMQVFFTFILAVWLLGERPGRVQIAGTAIAFVGIGLIALERLEPADLLPLLLMLASALCWGASNIIVKKAGRIDMLGLVVWSALIPPLPMLALALVFEGGTSLLPQVLDALTLRGALSTLFTAYLSTLFGYGLWAVLLGRYPANTVAPFTLLVPVFGISASYLLLGETISVLGAIGSLVVFAGLLVNVFGPRFATAARA